MYVYRGLSPEQTSYYYGIPSDITNDGKQLLWLFAKSMFAIDIIAYKHLKKCELSLFTRSTSKLDPFSCYFISSKLDLSLYKFLCCSVIRFRQWLEIDEALSSAFKNKPEMCMCKILLLH